MLIQNTRLKRNVISILAVALILCGCSRPAGTPTAVVAKPAVLLAAEVPKWSLYERDITAIGRYDNPYTAANASVTAEFTGPGGLRKVVRGFWDGDQKFKVRFTPTAVGAWSYRTSSADAGLNGQEGRFTCIAPLAGNHGFLRVDPQYPASFVWDDGTRYFMTGQTYYNIVNSALVSDDWKIAIDNSLGYGMNKVRMEIYPILYMDRYPLTHPYTGPALRPNRDRLNLAYWAKLDEVVGYLGSRGMVADLIVTNVYNKQRMFGSEEQNNRFLQYVISRYAAYNNVIWCMANEFDIAPRTSPTHADFDRMGTLVHDIDPWQAEGSARRPLSIHAGEWGNWGAFQFFDGAWVTHASIQLGHYAYDGPQKNSTSEPSEPRELTGNRGILWNIELMRKAGRSIMPVVNDEAMYAGWRERDGTYLNTPEFHRLFNWGSAVAGGYITEGDYRTPAYCTGDWVDDPEFYGVTKKLVEFFTTKGVEYWKMSSHNELVTSGERTYVLAEPGRQYVIYAAIGGTVSVDLADGKYKVRRFDPRTGTETSMEAVAGGRQQSFTMPDAYDWVLYLLSIDQSGSDGSVHPNAFRP